MLIVIPTMKSHTRPIYTDVMLLSLFTALQVLTSLVATDKNKDDAAQQLAGLKIGTPSPVPEVRPVQPPRPSQPPPPVDVDEEEDDEDNPFADSNAVVTPAYEKPEPRWWVKSRRKRSIITKIFDLGKLFDPYETFLGTCDG
jgi:hypothetical protein